MTTAGIIQRRRRIILALLFLIPQAACFAVTTTISNTKQARRRRRHERGVPHHSTTLSKPKIDNILPRTKLGMYTKYMSVLDSHPLRTKSVSSGIIAGVGDVLAQCIEAHKAHVPLPTLNWVRLASFWLVGTVFVGPFLHYWYDQLWRLGNCLENRYGTSKKVQTLIQVVVDQVLGVALFFPFYFFAYEFAEALLSWRVPSLLAARRNCGQELRSVLLMQYRVWPLVTFLIFSYIPERLRVLAGDIVGVFWNAYLSTRVA